MQIKQIKIGKVTTPNNVFLAPLAGYSNAVFRDMCARLGAGLTFTEMVSARGICYGNKKTIELLRVKDDYKGIKACQLFGHEAKYMRIACENEALAPFDIVDINMGCPMPKVYKTGAGCALLGDFDSAGKVISVCKKSGKTVTVKMRIGFEDGHYVTEDFAKMCEDSGADMITVHGRTRDKIYSGEVNFREIEKAKNAVKIPVIANGGIFTPFDATMMMKRTGADGVMIARGAMNDPWIFAEILGNDCGDKRATVLEQMKNMRKVYGDRYACVFMRKLTGLYLKGCKNAAYNRGRLMTCKTCEEVEDIIGGLEFL